MHKKYCIDTSVFIHDPNCIEVFKDNDLIIPIAVLEELDHLKVRADNVGANARKSIRILNSYFEGDITNGVDIGNNIKLFIDVKNIASEKFNSGSKDDSILTCCLANDGAIIVSKDINMRLRAKAFNIEAQDYENDKLKDVDEFYSGHRVIELENDMEISYNGLEDITGTVFESLYPNEGVQVLCNNSSFLFKRSGNQLKTLKVPSDVWSIKPRSKEQAFLLDYLLDPNIPLVTISGPSGTGKTLLATAVGLDSCIERKQYRAFKMFKPLATIPGQELGYLPGSLEEKINPFMGSFYDALEVLFKDSEVDKKLFLYKDRIQFEPLTFIRGRSITNNFIVIDEAQNLSKHDVKTMITRIGMGTKIVFLGDYNQIDVNYLDITNNGLTHLIEKFKYYDLAAHVTLQKCERSPLSALASQIL